MAASSSISFLKRPHAIRDQEHWANGHWSAWFGRGQSLEGCHGISSSAGLHSACSASRPARAGGAECHSRDQFQTCSGIGTLKGEAIQYLQIGWALCSADKRERAQEVLEHLPEPLNAKQLGLYDEPHEFYRSDRSQGAPPQDPLGDLAGLPGALRAGRSQCDTVGVTDVSCPSSKAADSREASAGGLLGFGDLDRSAGDDASLSRLADAPTPAICSPNRGA